VFVALENIAYTLKWPILEAKNRKKSSFKKSLIGMTPDIFIKILKIVFVSMNYFDSSKTICEVKLKIIEL
jgi:hypothetical protein